MIAWQVRVKNIMKTDALGQNDNHSLVTSSSSSLRLPKINFQQCSGRIDCAFPQPVQLRVFRRLLKNYRKAFEYLRMRLDDILIQVYVQELLKLVLQNTEVKKINLSSQYDKIEAQLLRILGSDQRKICCHAVPAGGTLSSR
ncbi:hypothetical protein TNCV_2440571 [Trichonephila clavipes]|nr:hypothetical protein TNCV_2440571 [Trichonephila clavipes]